MVKSVVGASFNEIVRIFAAEMAFFDQIIRGRKIPFWGDFEPKDGFWAKKVA